MTQLTMHAKGCPARAGRPTGKDTSWMANTDLVFLPYFKNAHWSLVMVDIAKERLLYLDPYQRPLVSGYCFP